MFRSVFVALMLTSTAAFAGPVAGNGVYSLQINGSDPIYFSDCTGIGSETEVVEHKIIAPSGQEITQKVPGRLRFTDITCKRGITTDNSLWEWRGLVESGDVATARKNATITVLDNTLTPVATWELINAWPSKLVAATETGGAVEELTLVTEGTKRQAE